MCTDNAEAPQTPGAEIEGLKAALEAVQCERDELQGRLQEANQDLDRVRAVVAGLKAELRAEHARTESLLQRASGASTEVAGIIDGLREELAVKEQRIQRDREMAKAIAQQLLPVYIPVVEGVDIAVRYNPTETVGADLYDVIDMGHRCLGILVADAAGSGLRAALLAAMTKMAFKTFTAGEFSPKDIMAKVNEELKAHTLDGQFLTAFFAVLDCETLVLKFVNASHCPPVLIRDREFQLLDTEGLFLGMFDDPKYEERQTQLCVADKLVFYTDGITQAMGCEGEIYRNQRLYEFLTERSDEAINDIANELYDDLRRYTGGEGLRDDAALLGLEVVSKPCEERTITIPSDPAEIPHVDSVAISQLQARGYGERAVFGVKLALEEALINAIKHGNRNDKAKKVRVSFSIDNEKAVISVADEGPGFDVNKVPDPTEDENLEVEHGRGVYLIRAYMDEVSYNKKGNEVTMVKCAPWVSQRKSGNDS